jgi:TPR repeat protein
MAKREQGDMVRQKEANRLYQRGEQHWSRGRLRLAFRCFLAAAKAGTVPTFRIVAQFYDRGEGVKADENAALFWYRRAYRDGDDYSAANNIGCIWRDRGKPNRALMWFQRAIKLGDADASLNIAKIYLYKKADLGKAIHYLNKTRKSRRATEGSRGEAEALLKKAKGNRMDSASRSRSPRGPN